MYFYVFDSYLQDRKYSAEVARVEARLGVLGIQGHQEKITILKNIQEATAEAIRRGATTIVAVGNDRTVTKILPPVVEHGLTLGLIPIGPEQAMADILGIPHGLAACDILSRRLTRRLDVGRANNLYFLLQVQMPAGATVICDDQYSVESIDPQGIMAITNLGSGPSGWPEDGQLELVVKPRAGSWVPFRRSYSAASVFPIRRAKLQCQRSDDTLMLDGQTVVKAPTIVELGEKKVEVIVGRERKF